MKPNVVLVGAAKAGTTSLYNYLIDHPEVFLPKERKEINFLGGVNQTVFSDDEYLKMYRSSEYYPVRMDISTSYLYAQDTPAKIKSLLGDDTKIIALIRNPIEASFSLWKQMRHYGGEELSFEEALKAEEKRRDDVGTRQNLDGWDANYFYTDRYKYAPQLQYYYDNFPAENIKVFVFEEFFEDLIGSWQELCEFLEISPSYIPKSFGNIYNPASFGHKSELLHNLIYKKMPIKKLFTWALPESVKARLRLILDDLNKKQNKNETMAPETREKLQKTFAKDVDAIEKLLNKPIANTWFNR